MATKGDYATSHGNMVRFNSVTGEWQVLYRPNFPNGGPIRAMGFERREDAVKVRVPRATC